MPATAIVTEPFTELAGAFAVTLGMPGYPVVTLPHPVSSKDDATLRALARAAAVEVAQRLTVPT